LASLSITSVGESRPATVAAGSREFNVAAHGLRGVAAMMVFFAHLVGGTAEHIYAADSQYVTLTRPFWNFGTFGVMLFFVISGFVILPSVFRYSLGEFALRRFMRIYPMFFAFSLLFVVLNLALGAYPKLNTPLAVVSGLLFINLFTGTEQLTPNAWSLSFEVMFYTGTVLIYYFAVVRRNAVATVLAVVLAAAFWARFPITTYFLLGLVVRIVHDRRIFIPTGVARVLEVIIFVAMAWLASFDHYEYVWADLARPVVIPLIACTGAYFYLAVHSRSLTALLLGNRATLYLGTVSYSLYIVHPYIYLPMRLAFDRLGWFDGDPFASLALFAVAVTPPMLAATAIVHATLERGPYAAFFRQAIYRRSRTPTPT
jgi:peptidoglycan/LPS O-acetylase OafA/YrhL